MINSNESCEGAHRLHIRVQKYNTARTWRRRQAERPRRFEMLFNTLSEHQTSQAAKT
jgi:hypothetical protein